ncbi:Riboflavin synthase eubacterial/eukaryotic [plant metagenome]|uniref:Riboflavin synthase n=1 Tax=plant metagenome TaxID=1297885 RepID=A0A484U9C1_9ZZZZ
MFTGIIAAVGRIDEVQPLQQGASDAGVRLRVTAGSLPLDDVRIGDSIAIQGACMTVVAMADNQFDVEVSRESLRLTAGLDAVGPVNLEKALRVGDYLGGHIVSGHVDGLGEVQRFAPVGESHELVIRAPQALGRYLAYKGSITVNGVSLTVNRVEDVAAGCDFSINIIPHTLSATTLGALTPGSRVNLEIDTIARYVDRMMGQGVRAPG